MDLIENRPKKPRRWSDPFKKGVPTPPVVPPNRFSMTGPDVLGTASTPVRPTFSSTLRLEAKVREKGVPYTSSRTSLPKKYTHPPGSSHLLEYGTTGGGSDVMGLFFSTSATQAHESQWLWHPPERHTASAEVVVVSAVEGGFGGSPGQYPNGLDLESWKPVSLYQA